MLIYLLDEVKKEELPVKLTVDYTLPCSDLFVIFFSTNETWGLSEGQSSRPYHEYQLKKVNHQVVASVSYERESYTLTLGFFHSNQQFVPFIMDQVRTGNDYSGGRFSIAQECYNHYYSNQVLFNYPEHPHFLSSEKETLTLQEVATKAMQKDIENKEEDKAYALAPTRTFQADKLVSHEEFMNFLEQQVAKLELR